MAPTTARYCLESKPAATLVLQQVADWRHCPPLPRMSLPIASAPRFPFRPSAMRGALVTVGLVVLAALASPRTPSGDIIFLMPGNLTDALRAIAPVGIISLAMTLVIVAGGIDLSVGSIVALAGVMAARVLTQWHPTNTGWVVHVTFALGAAALAGLIVGVLNGLLVARLGIQPFVITLASMIGVRGLSLWLSNNERIGLGVGADAAGRFGLLLAHKGTMLTLLLLLAAGFGLLLDRTVLGRSIRAVGDNPAAASLAGLAIGRTRVIVYALSGLLSGLAGALLAARTTTGDPNAGVAMELDAIAVVVIGGASLSGGRGGILGTLNGTLILGLVTNILGLRNVDFNLQLVLKALIILLAVGLQRRGRPA